MTTAREAALAAWGRERQYRAERWAAALATEAEAAARWWGEQFRPADAPPPGAPATTDSVVRPGVPGVHLAADDDFVLEFVPRNGAPGGALDVYVLLRCPECSQLVPSAYSAPAATLADVGQSLEAGPAFHSAPGSLSVGGQAVAVVCPGGASSDNEAAQPSLGDLLLTVMTGLVRDVVTEVLEQRDGTAG